MQSFEMAEQFSIGKKYDIFCTYIQAEYLKQFPERGQPYLDCMYIYGVIIIYSLSFTWSSAVIIGNLHLYILFLVFFCAIKPHRIIAAASSVDVFFFIVSFTIDLTIE